MPPKNKRKTTSAPKLATVEDLASVLGVDMPALRRLEHARYHHGVIPKKRGATPRTISKPPQALAEVQHAILQYLLRNGRWAEPAAHGFVPGRSIVTGAKKHVGQRVAANIDLVDFFPSILFVRVVRVFRRLGHAEDVVQSLARLCTETSATDASLHARHLPQGACTSPALANLVCRELDRRLDGLAKHSGFVYTRYADDITFSGDSRERLGGLLVTARRIIRAEGFVEHPDKTRVMGRRRTVTGLVVSEGKVNVPRKERRRLRAILHNAARDGLEPQNRDGVEDFGHVLEGKIAYLNMVDPSKAETWLAALDEAL